MVSTIAKLEEKIRDRINDGRKQHELLGRSADWNRLCSGLDVIGDTELALDSYLAHNPIQDIGVRYLHVYGALQLLQTQQDAVAQVCEALQLKPKSSPKIPLVRKVRSNAVGHPMHQREDNSSRSHFIVRMSLSQHGFTMFTESDDEWGHSEQNVSIPALIDLQRDSLTQTLTEVVELLDEAEMSHRKEHKSEKVESCFPSTLSYYFSKIFEAARSPSIYPLGKTHVELVAECLAKMRDMLEKRGEWGIYPSIDYEYELLEYPLERLREFFSGNEESSLNEKDAHIFAEFTKFRMASLRQIAVEIDERYESSPDDDA